MKTSLKLIYVLTLSLMFNLLSCNNDDDIDYSIMVMDLDISIDENPSDADSIGNVQATSDDTLSFSLISQTPNGAIAIDPASGELTIADARFFNYEVYTTIVATISVSNSVETETIAATITIIDVAELTAQDTTLTIDENPSNGVVVGSVQVSSGNPIGYSIETQNPIGAIAIDTNSGEITVADDTLFDFETNPTITATIALSSLGEMQTVTVTIDLNDLNEMGEYKYGGVIFWINATGDEGLVCSINDLNNGNTIQWGNNGIEYQETGATDTAIGTGQANTNAIINVQGTGNYAASLCDNLSLNGYSDWYLPSKDELNAMFINHPMINSVATANGGDAFSVIYWTSSQATTNTNIVWIQFLQSGTQGINNKLNLASVRAIRHWTDF